MSVTDEPHDRPRFRTRMAGYDRDEVQAFVANILSDFAAERRECERLRRILEEDTSSLSTPERESGAAREASRILATAERVAADVRSQAAEEASRVVASARAQAGEEGERLLAEARAKAGAIVSDAETRAAQLVDAAAARTAALEQRTLVLRAQYRQLRTAFEAAADTTATALSEIAHVENELPASKSEPAGV